MFNMIIMNTITFNKNNNEIPDKST